MVQVLFFSVTQPRTVAEIVILFSEIHDFLCQDAVSHLKRVTFNALQRNKEDGKLSHVFSAESFVFNNGGFRKKSLLARSITRMVFVDLQKRLQRIHEKCLAEPPRTRYQLDCCP